MDNKSQLDVPIVDNKSKKDDILSAYQSLLQKYQESAEGTETRKAVVERKKEDEIVQKASQYSIELIEQSASGLEMSVKKWLFNLSETLSKEAEKLQNIKEAVLIEKRRLEEVHAISAEADALSQLIQAHQEKKKRLEEEFESQDLEFKKNTQNQQDAWKREQEHYEYELQLKRKREEDEYQEKKQAKEKELRERELNIQGQEAELSDLRKRNKEFDRELSDGLARVKEETENFVRAEENTKAMLLYEKNSAERKIMEMTIESLRQKVKEQDEMISHSKKELDEANRGVKDIAIKVIESRRNREYEQNKQQQENS